MSEAKPVFYVVDDDEALLDITSSLLEKAGYEVKKSTSSEQALKEIIELQPDCVISDLSMPTLSGDELFEKIKQEKNIKLPVFILMTSHHYGYDVNLAEKTGVNGYIRKPINLDTFVDEILGFVHQKMFVQFWGVRGTLPVPGKDTAEYGGNTNCISLTIGKKNLFIFDAGSGIKPLSNHLLSLKKFPISAKLFITHPHWDHINGFPFFVPFYMKNNEFEIFGTNHPNSSLERTLCAQMDNVYFPVTVKEFSAHLTYHPITEESFLINDIKISTQFLVHPGKCLGYKVEHNKKIFCYITDHEIYPENSKCYNKYDFDRLVSFISHADILIIDATYKDEEYPMKESWGHSSVSRVIDVAHQAKVKTVCLHHHDPEQTDKDIDYKVAQAHKRLAELHSETKCIAPKEGDNLFI